MRKAGAIRAGDGRRAREAALCWRGGRLHRAYRALPLCAGDDVSKRALCSGESMPRFLRWRRFSEGAPSRASFLSLRDEGVSFASGAIFEVSRAGRGRCFLMGWTSRASFLSLRDEGVSFASGAILEVSRAVRGKRLLMGWTSRALFLSLRDEGVFSALCAIREVVLRAAISFDARA